MIRKATADDLPRLVEMGLRFANETTYKEHVNADEARLADLVAALLASQESVIFVSGSDACLTGMIALCAHDHLFSGERTVTELAWWVEPEARGHGLRLLRAAESWAKDNGAGRLQMIAPNDRVAALYSRLGYVAMETTFLKEL